MTIADIDVIIAKLQAALLDADATKMNHSIGDASYQPDGHLETVQKQLEYWTNLRNRRASAGRSFRQNRKAV